MLKLEEIIPGTLRIKDSPHEYTRKETLSILENMTMVDLLCNVCEGIYSKTCAIIDTNLVDEYSKTHRAGRVNELRVDLPLVEVVDYINNILHLRTDGCCSGHTITLDPIEYKAKDRYGNFIEIVKYRPNPNEACFGYLHFRYKPSAPIVNVLKEKLLNVQIGKKSHDIHFEINEYNGGGNDIWSIEWHTAKTQDAIDEACAYLTKIVIENL